MHERENVKEQHQTSRTASSGTGGETEPRPIDGRSRDCAASGDLTEIEWKPDSITFAKIPGSPASGATVVTVGIRGAIRGKNKYMPDGSVARPDAVVLDDPQTDADARSPVQVEKLEGIINNTVEGLVGPGEELAMMMPCTVIQEGDLADRYLNRNIYPRWGGLRFKMIETMPERMDLWEQYKELRKDGAIQAGLVTLIKDLLAACYDVEGDAEHPAFSKILIDSGYKPEIAVV